MPENYAFTWGMNCIENLRPGNVQSTLRSLFRNGRVDILYPTIYEKTSDRKWYLVIVRRDGKPTSSRCLETSQRDEAIARVQHLLQPLFDSRYVSRNLQRPHGSDTSRQPNVECLRSGYPELGHWPDFVLRFAWKIFSRVIHATDFCDIGDFSEKTPRDESFLDYLWHFKVLGDYDNFPRALRHSLGDFLSGEVAIWRKWKTAGGAFVIEERRQHFC